MWKHQVLRPAVYARFSWTDRLAVGREEDDPLRNFGAVIHGWCAAVEDTFAGDAVCEWVVSCI